jgi:hypothetical protein
MEVAVVAEDSIRPICRENLDILGFQDCDLPGIACISGAFFKYVEEG